MAMMECRDCFRLADSRCFRRCTGCGAPLCDDCADRNMCMCEECGDYE